MPENDAVALEIDVQQVHQMLSDKDDFLLVDCREASEFENCRIAGSVLIPMNDTPNQIAKFDAYRDKPIVIHCHHGGRSLRVAHWLREQGFPQTQSMAGGIDQWSDEIDPTVPKY